MSDPAPDLDRQIAEIEASLKLSLPDAARHALEQRRTHLLAERAAVQGAVTIGGVAQVAGPVVGVNYGVIQAFFGGAPPEHGARLLADYLDALIGECDQLRLYRLTGRRQSGAEQDALPPLRLQAVYTSLTTDGAPVAVGRPRTRPAAHLRTLLDRLARRSRAAADCPPEAVREIVLVQDAPHAAGRALPSEAITRATLDELPLDALLTLHLNRPPLALEAIQQQRRLVLLGEPGAGKSTVLRYLALLLAQRLRAPAAPLPGWPEQDLPIPLLCPLGQVAAALAQGDGDADAALWKTLGDVLEGPQGLRAGLRDYLTPALRHGGVLLLCDGLDELPAGSDGAPGPRQAVSAALRRLAVQAPQARIVLTSRALPYYAPGDWQMHAEEGWQTRTIQPLAFGQVRTFVRSWYAALAATDPALTRDEATARAGALLGELAARERLHALVRSPLLLTMLAILHYNTEEIPRDRARLYHECVQLLLERWEPVRTPGLARPGLLERLGNIPGLDLDLLRGVLHELAFLAHDGPPDDDGRGLLDGAALEGRMLRFFRQLRCADPARQVTTFVEALRADAGLLQARADDRYTFPHLTFQEYLAACYLADQRDLTGLAYPRWHGADAERWREALLLLMGRLRQQGAKAVERDGVPWMQRLTAARVGRQSKPPAQRRRDALLAALSYAEIGGRAALASSDLDVEGLVEDPLRQAILELLDAPDPAIGLADRIAAADALGELGDPRFPVTMDEWRAELAQRNERFGAPAGYWCYVRPGSYRIGGWDADHSAAEIALLGFWIARFPITVVQYAPFVAVGYTPHAESWWSAQGWRWRQKSAHTEPLYWNEASLTRAIQPVIGVTWYETTAFCTWLSEQLAETLPDGYVVRLPTEVEWEAAAAYDAHMHRHAYPWGDAMYAENAIALDSNLRRAAPVICCPGGAAACGAWDVIGNTWEWMMSSFHAYPLQSDKSSADFRCMDPAPQEQNRAVRGGSWRVDRTALHCRLREARIPRDRGVSHGFRVVVASRIAS